MSQKVKIMLVDNDGKVVQKGKLFLEARPALMRWTIKDKTNNQERSTYFRRVGYDEYLELTAEQTVHVLDWLKTEETSPDELTIDKVAEILEAAPKLVKPVKLLVKPGEEE